MKSKVLILNPSLTTFSVTKYSAKLKNPYVYVRLSIFLFIVLTLVLMRIYTPSYNATIECLEDYVHNKMQYPNDLVNENIVWRKIFQISSSALMDFTFFFTFIHWVLRINNSRLLVSMVMFYGCRGVFAQALFKLYYPPGFLWPFPGVYSLVVAYGQYSDFFFSGHAGFLMLCSMELRARKLYFMSYLTILINMYMIFVLLTFRIHYSFDVTTGLLFAHYSFMITEKYLETLDRFWLNIYIELCGYISKSTKKIIIRIRK